MVTARPAVGACTETSRAMSAVLLALLPTAHEEGRKQAFEAVKAAVLQLTGAYAIAVWAMTVAPIALVGALRETSILFAVLIGWLWFGERMDRMKAGAAAAIVLGIALTRLA